MSWRFEIAATAECSFERLDPDVARRAYERLEWFVDNFEELTHHPLTGEVKGSFKLRVGDWRIVYEIHSFKQTIYVTGVEHRSKAYKKRR